MNDKRRKQIQLIISDLKKMQNRIELIKDDEQDYYDSIPENLSTSNRAMDSENAIEELEEAIDLLNDTLNALQNSRL